MAESKEDKSKGARQKALAEKAATTCVVKNAFGNCTGKRACGPAGLAACDLPNSLKYPTLGTNPAR